MSNIRDADKQTDTENYIEMAFGILWEIIRQHGEFLFQNVTSLIIITKAA